MMMPAMSATIGWMLAAVMVNSIGWAPFGLRAGFR
jgi:hypothetical protein